MTAVALAPTQAQPAAPSARPHAALPPAHERLAFSAVLDSVPGGDAKAKLSSGGRAETPDESQPRDHPQAQLMSSSSIFNAALSSLLVAPPAGAANGEPSQETEALAQGAQPGEGEKAAGPRQTIGLAEEALKRTEREAAAGEGGAP